MAKIIIDRGGTVQIKEQYEVPYAVARAVDVLIEHYKKHKQLNGKRNVLEVMEE